MKKLIKKILSWLKKPSIFFKESAPIYPSVEKQGIKIHIGSGEINLQGWINIDARKFAHTHINTDSLVLNEFTDNAINYIYMCHILEHLSFEEVKILLEDLNKKLSKDGVLMISVPNFQSIAMIYQETDFNLEKIKFALMGGQDYEHNFHKSVYDFKNLKSLFEEAGFQSVTQWDTKEEFGELIGDWSHYHEKINGKKIPLSLNLKGLKK